MVGRGIRSLTVAARCTEPRALASGSLYQPENLYPRPRTVSKNCGFLGLSSNFWRSQAICTSTVRVDRLGLVPPNVPQKLLAGDHGPTVLDQVPKNLELPSGESNGLPVAGDFGGTEINPDTAELHDGGVRGAGASEERLHAGQQLGHVEGLDQVIVGAEPEAGHAVGHLASGGKHQDGRGDAGLAKLAAHLEAAASGEHDVQEDQVVVGRSGGAPEAFVAVAGAVDVIAFGLKAVGEGHDEGGLVLNQEQASFHETGRGAGSE